MFIMGGLIRTSLRNTVQISHMHIAWCCSYIGRSGAVGGAVGVDDPTGLGGELAEDLVDVGAGGEAVTAVLAEAVEDLGGDGPPLPLSHLGLLSFLCASPTVASRVLHLSRRWNTVDLMGV